MEQWTDQNWSERFGVVYKCRVSTIYHRKRERFFSLLDKLSSAFALVAGAGAMTDFLPSASAKAIAGAIVAAVTLPGIVFGWADKSRAHALLAAKFVNLEADIEGAGVLEAQALDKLKEQALLIEMEEPPQLSCLTRICQNEIAFATNEPSSMTDIPWWKHWLAHFLDLPANLPKADQTKAA